MLKQVQHIAGLVQLAMLNALRCNFLKQRFTKKSG